MSDNLLIPVSELFENMKENNNNKNDIWIHPKLAIQLALWISDEFLIKISNWYLDMLTLIKFN